MKNLNKILSHRYTEASAACRIDCGGTLDIKTFHYPLSHLSPCTFNIALNMRTHVKLLPSQPGVVKVSSEGFQTETYLSDRAPFNSPLGLIFAVAAYFGVEGVHIQITSESPPRSALGGSSAAVVAVIAALSMALNGRVSQEKTALLAHTIEDAIMSVPCGLQDQLAAVYGGVHAWYWPSEPTEPLFKGLDVLTRADYGALESRLMLAYCGIHHESRNINSKWVQHFVTGQERSLWADIASITNVFVQALRVKDWASAADALNREVEIRRNVTPEVFDELGMELVTSAQSHSCGVRFTGAGGGGCIWALGEAEDIEKLRPVWTDILSQRQSARLLEAKVDPKGLEVT